MKANKTTNNTLTHRKKLNEDTVSGYLFISVALIIFCLFTLYPLINSVIISFQKYNPIQSQWIGLQNYKSTFQDAIFYKALKNTLFYTICTVPINLLIAFVLSLLIFPFKSRTQTVFKAMYYLPAVASGVSLSVVWLWIYDPMPTGLLNQLLSTFGIANQNWLGTSKTSMFSLILMSWLSSHGANVIIYIAGMLGISTEYFEASALDGATFFQKVRFIVWPMLKPTTLFLLVTGIIKSFQVFMNAYMMTGGGPDNATTMVGLLIFNNAFTYFDFGKACAQALVLTAVIASISLIQFKYMGKDIEY